MPAKDIFLSYANEDLDQAKLFISVLEKQGWSVWWDRTDIPPGRDFGEVIEEAVQAASCVVVLWSKRSVKKKWVKNEAREGAEPDILVPVRVDDVKVPFEFKWLQTAQLQGWNGEPVHPRR